MKALLVLLVLTVVGSTSFCQTVVDLFKNKRFANMDGYVVVEKDTLRGTICIPLEKDEINYGSLRNKVIFMDSAGLKKQYTTKDIAAFGLSDDDIGGDYIRLGDENGNKAFLKVVVAGRFYLLQETFTARTNNGLLLNSKVYWILEENGAAFRIEPDPQTSAIRKKDLKFLANLLPNSIDTESNVFISDLVKILTDANKGK